MRLAYLCNLYPAVSHSFVRREIEAVERRGHQVQRFTIRPPKKDLRDEADLREVQLTECVLGQGGARLLFAWLALLVTRPGRSVSAVAHAWRLSGPGLKSKMRHLAYLLEAAWLARRLNQLKVEHLHAHFGTNPAAVALLVRALGGPPFSFTAHGPDEFDAPVTLSLPEKIEAARFVVAISSYGRSQLMRWSSPEHWNKILVIRCGVDPSFLETEPRPIPLDSRELVCVARLSAQKGLPLLVAACEQLRASGEVFTLTIIGDGEMRPEIEREIRGRGLENVIILAGIRSSAEIRDHLLSARAFVLPSLAEGLPVVLMEALALGRPVITTAIAGIPELVGGECGWLVPAGSQEALVTAMKSALHQTPERLASMGATGAERVRRLHSSETNADALISALDPSAAPPDSTYIR